MKFFLNQAVVPTLHQLITYVELDPTLIRLGFVLFRTMNRKVWRIVSPQEVDLDFNELERQLLPDFKLTFQPVEAKLLRMEGNM